MIFCKIRLISKNHVSLSSFVLLLLKAKKFNIISRSFLKKKGRKRVTILKSPHVNKKAQEQFEYLIFCKVTIVHSPNLLKYMAFLKFLSAHQFTDVSLSIKINSSEKNFCTNVFNPNRRVLKKIPFNNNKNRKMLHVGKLFSQRSLVTTIKVFSVYGGFAV